MANEGQDPNKGKELINLSEKGKDVILKGRSSVSPHSNTGKQLIVKVGEAYQGVLAKIQAGAAPIVEAVKTWGQTQKANLVNFGNQLQGAWWYRNFGQAGEKLREPGFRQWVLATGEVGIVLISGGWSLAKGIVRKNPKVAVVILVATTLTTGTVLASDATDPTRPAQVEQEKPPAQVVQEDKDSGTKGSGGGAGGDNAGAPPPKEQSDDPNCPPGTIPIRNQAFVDPGGMMGPTAPATAEPAATPTAHPSAPPAPDPTADPSASPTAAPASPPPAATPTPDPADTPSAPPAPDPTASPTAAPAAPPAPDPTDTPTASPTAAPAGQPIPSDCMEDPNR